MTRKVQPEERSGESLLTLWLRRAISIPIYFGLAGLFLGTSGLWIPLSLGIDSGWGPRWIFPRTRALGFVTFYLLCEVWGVLAATLIWVGTLGGHLGGRGAFLDANILLQRWWTHALFRGCLFFFSMKVETEGLERGREGPMLLFVRHTSAADTLLAAAFVANPNRILLRYVLKRELFWDPCLDIVGRRLPNAFIDRKAPRMKAEITAIVQLATGLDNGSAVLIYPEGTRFSEAKLARGLARLKENCQDELWSIANDFQHVLPPRTGGALALIEASPGVDIVLLEHTGFEGVATIPSVLGGALVGQTLRVRLRRIAASEVPSQGQDRWLFDRWTEMDQWISASTRTTGDRA